MFNEISRTIAYCHVQISKKKNPSIYVRTYNLAGPVVRSAVIIRTLTARTYLSIQKQHNWSAQPCLPD